MIETNNCNEIPLLIESNIAVQGGAFCLKGSRITIGGILEGMQAIRDNILDEMVKNLSKHFQYNINKKDLRTVLEQYAYCKEFVNDLGILQGENMYC